MMRVAYIHVSLLLEILKKERGKKERRACYAKLGTSGGRLRETVSVRNQARTGQSTTGAAADWYKRRYSFRNNTNTQKEEHLCVWGRNQEAHGGE